MEKMEKIITIELGSEEMEVYYNFYKSDDSTGTPEHIDINAVYYEGLDLIYIVNEIPGFTERIIREVMNEKKKERNPMMRPINRHIPTANEIIGAIHSICAPRI